MRLLLIAAALLAATTQAAAENAPERGEGFVPRLVVKFRAPGEAGIAKLSADTGVTLYRVRTLAVGAEVFTSPQIQSESDADALAARLSRHPGVLYAERSRRLRPERVPNDPQLAQQFYLQSGPAAIDAMSAWDVTTGSPAIVVAVLDTGTTGHADVAGRALPGYDFVSNLEIANDGDARDPNPSDPGDWVAREDLSPALVEKECSISGSSWHGTSVMGVIGANANNGQYLAGVDWGARLVPVRVLGKCYGDDPDAADAIMWAAGLPVPGAPVNHAPAQVINLSLGDPGPCPAFMQEAITAALAHGVTRAIVAAAGNQNSGGDHFPSSCAGVIAVAATNSGGGRASYSNFGPRVDLAAPGGFGGGQGFLTLTNTGATAPVADTTSLRSGTSFATPLVSGVAALMLAVAPGLTANALRDLIKASTKPFPAGSSCAGVCGAGILDAASAVRNARATTSGTVRTLLVEYYNGALDHYFLTWVPNEIVLLDEGVSLKGWVRTGKTFEALLTPTTLTAPVCRIYIPPGKGDGHYFGRDARECAGTLASNPSFVSEDPAFFHLFVATAGTCPAGLRPVYRVFSNRPDANHRYTVERAVRDEMVAKGWLAEGDGPDTVVMCAPD